MNYKRITCFTSTRQVSQIFLLFIAICMLSSLRYDYTGSTQSLVLKFHDKHAIVISKSDSILSWMAKNHVPTVELSVIENGKLTQQKAYGKLPDGRSASTETVFSIASLTKTVVAMTVMELVASGKLSLDEPLDKYWIDPDVSDNPWVRKLTPRIILSHQTGFANWRSEEPSKKLVFEFEPGTKFQYSGEGMEYLRRALVSKFREPLEQLSTKFLFKPLTLSNTSYLWSELKDTTQYAGMYDGNGRVYPMFRQKEASAAYGILTTTSDYAKIGMAALKFRQFRPSLFDEMVRTQVVVDSSRRLAWGLGWALIKDLPGKEYALYHTGVDAGVRTVIILLPKTNRGLIIFTNGDKGEDVYNAIIKSSMNVGPELVKRVTF